MNFAREDRTNLVAKFTGIGTCIVQTCKINFESPTGIGLHALEPKIVYGQQWRRRTTGGVDPIIHHVITWNLVSGADVSILCSRPDGGVNHLQGPWRGKNAPELCLLTLDH